MTEDYSVRAHNLTVAENKELAVIIARYLSGENRTVPGIYPGLFRDVFKGTIAFSTDFKFNEAQSVCAESTNKGTVN